MTENGSATSGGMASLPDHVFAYSGLRPLDSNLQQFPVDDWRGAPQQDPDRGPKRLIADIRL